MLQPAAVLYTCCFTTIYSSYCLILLFFMLNYYTLCLHLLFTCLQDKDSRPRVEVEKERIDVDVKLVWQP